MGRRKFRLVARKNGERQRREKFARVSSLVVSVPKSKLPASNLQSLETQLTAQGTLPHPWTLTSTTNEGNRKLILCALDTSRAPPILRFTVSIGDDFTWLLSVYGRTITPQSCHALSDAPDMLNSIDKITLFLSILEHCTICTGNPDDKFLQVAQRREGVFKDHSGTKVVASVDEVTSPTTPSIRHSSCDMLLSAESRYSRCQQCSKYRTSLHTYSLRQATLSDDRLDASSHTTYSSLTSTEKDARMKSLHSSLKQSEKRMKHLKEKLDVALETRGVMDDSLTDDMEAIISDGNKSILDEFPEGSFARLFWQQQINGLRRKDKSLKKGIRWDPLMIKWCLYLRHKSSGAYEMLRKTGVISLPSQRTLRDYTHYANTTVGFSKDVDAQLARASKLDSCEDYEKCIIMLMDEMYVKEELVYDKHTGALVGFVNLGDINSHLTAYEQSLSQKSTSLSESLATTMMVFVVQGLLSSLSFPYAQFPCHNVTGQLLFNPFWEAVFRLERMGFKVLGVTFDGASVNRRLMKIHSPKDDLLHKVPNPYAVDGRELLFFSDPPHLIKTTRNCWASKVSLEQWEAHIMGPY